MEHQTDFVVSLVSTRYTLCMKDILTNFFVCEQGKVVIENK